MQVLDKSSPDFIYDAVVIGAGGGGMSLLFALHHSGYLIDHKVLVIEPETKIQNDRTWCFWAKETDPIVRQWQPIISEKWDYVIVQGRKQPIAPYQYYHIRSADLYAYVTDALAVYDDLHWIRSKANQVNLSEDNNCEVILEDGAISAKYVFDSRLNSDQLQMLQEKHTVWQSFAGWRVKLSAPIDDDESIRLMDFDIPQDGYTQFIYVLPTDNNEALVEVTRFGTDKIDKLYADNILKSWLQDFDSNYEILEIESGAIPMHMGLNPIAEKHQPGLRHIPIGTSAGAVKATTGYAIHAIFQHSMKLSEALKDSTASLPTPFHSGRFNFYDRLLIYILIHFPSWGRPIFEQLFQKVSPVKVLTFLDEKTNLWQEIPLLLSLPFKPFLKALWSTTFQSSKIPRNVSDYYPLKRSFIVPLIIAFIALGMYWWTPVALEVIAPGALLIGLVFPGIPHGALDHCLSPAGQLRGMALIRFILLYLFFMAAIIALWYFSPLLGVLTFIAYSAWHFGETDLRHWGIFSPSKAWFYGLALLLFILVTHWEETNQYFKALGVNVSLVYLSDFSEEIAIMSMIIILIMGLFTSAQARYSWAQTVIILVIGSFLPLLPAFGLYFIGLHSVRGWTHLRNGLGKSSGKLMRQALPFSMGAYLMFVALFFMILYTDFDVKGLIPAIFVFLAAISAPHIIMMHRFYGHSN